jgi:hypothetical protein
MALPPRLAPVDISAHHGFIAALGVKALWLKYWPQKAG